MFSGGKKKTSRMKWIMKNKYLGVIHLVRTQSFPKN